MENKENQLPQSQTNPQLEQKDPQIQDSVSDDLKTKKRLPKPLVYSLFALLFMVIGASLGFWLYQDNFLKKDTIEIQDITSSQEQPIPSSPTSTKSPVIFPTESSPGVEWRVYSFDVWRDKKYSIGYPADWKLNVEYADKQMLGEDATDDKYVSWIRISKDGYIFHLYFPTAFGMDFCFYPESEPYPPFYEGPEDYDFMTLKEYVKVDSEYAKYVRGMIPLSENLDGQNKYYLNVCNREKPQESIFMGFVKYYLPTANPDEEILSTMDDILKSYHQIQ